MKEYMTPAVWHVLGERQRQKTVEGWTDEHDDKHVGGSLSLAGGCYALNAGIKLNRGFSANEKSPPTLCPVDWPWDTAWWKPTTVRRDLVKAAALIIAEIERLDRLAAKGCAETKRHDSHLGDYYTPFRSSEGRYERGGHMGDYW